MHKGGRFVCNKIAAGICSWKVYFCLQRLNICRMINDAAYFPVSNQLISFALYITKQVRRTMKVLIMSMHYQTFL